MTVALVGFVAMCVVSCELLTMPLLAVCLHRYGGFVGVFELRYHCVVLLGTSGMMWRNEGSLMRKHMI
jgi:hypothetical protein